MRPLHLHIQAIMSALGVKRAAAAMGVSEGRAYKYGQPEDVNGEPIPLTRLLRLIAFAAEDQRPAVQEHLGDILTQFIPRQWLLVKRDLARRLREDVDALITGRTPESVPVETLLLCDGCGDPLQVIAGPHGSYKYVCRGCIAG